MIVELNISNVIVSPELNAAQITITPVFSSGQITPEERAKLAGIEENANNYIHPETHPSSILDVVDAVNGATNKFMNERGEMVAVATSSIGVTGSPLYASTENSDVAGYKSLVGTPQALETEITLTAKSTDSIVWGAKYLSAPFTEAVTIPTTAYGFDYWRKVSAANGTSRKHLRVFLYRAGVETDIITPLVSPDINETEFTERQISYIFPELALLAGDRIGIQEGFSTTHAINVTLTYIVGDGRGWFMRLPLPLKHESLTDKNSEADFQHVDTTTTKPTLDAADMVAIKDSVTGDVVLTPKSNFNADNLIAEYVHTSNLEVSGFTVDIATGTYTKSGHGLVNGDLIYPVQNTNTYTTTLTIKDYIFQNWYATQPRRFVVNATSDTFQLSLTSGGAVEILTNLASTDLTKWHFERPDNRVEGVLRFSNIHTASENSNNIRVVLGGKFLYSGLYFNINTNVADTRYTTTEQATPRAIFMGDNLSCFGTIEYIINTAHDRAINVRTFLIKDKDLSVALKSDELFYRFESGVVQYIQLSYFYPANGLTVKIYKI